MRIAQKGRGWGALREKGEWNGSLLRVTIARGGYILGTTRPFEAGQFLFETSPPFGNRLNNEIEIVLLLLFFLPLFSTRNFSAPLSGMASRGIFTSLHIQQAIHWRGGKGLSVLETWIYVASLGMERCKFSNRIGEISRFIAA